MNERYQRITQALNILKLVINIHQTFLVDSDKEHPQRVHLLRILRLFSRMSQQGHLILKNTRDLLQRFQKSMNFITQR